MAPKSELMVYIGVADGMTTNYKFMQSPNNVIFTLAHALFDEEMFSKCEGTKKYKHKRFQSLTSHEHAQNEQHHPPPTTKDEDNDFFNQSSSHHSCLERERKGKGQDVAPEPPRTPVREVQTPSPTPCSAPEEPTPVHQRFRHSKHIGKVPHMELFDLFWFKTPI
jgi:hypothetical protein